MNKKEYMQYQLLISNSARFNQHFPFQKIMLRKIIDFLFNDMLSTKIKMNKSAISKHDTYFNK